MPKLAQVRAAQEVRNEGGLATAIADRAGLRQKRGARLSVLQRAAAIAALRIW